jgi:hypothetical protein
MVIGFQVAVLALDLSILLALLFRSRTVVGLIMNGFRKLRPCALVENNSLTITIACWRLEKDVDA